MASVDPYRRQLPIEGPLSLGDLLDRSFRVYRARFGVLVVTAALILAPLSIISGAATGRFMVNYLDFVQGVMVEGAEPSNAMLGELLASFGMTGTLILLLWMFGLIANSIVTLAATHHVLAFLHGASLSVPAGLRQSLRSLAALLGLYIVRGLALFVAAMAMVLALVVVVVVFSLLLGGAFYLFDNNLGGGENIIVVLGAVLLFVCLYVLAFILVAAPLVILSARWLGAVPALVAEDLGPLAALARSWALTRGNAWRAIGYFILLSLLSFLVVSLPLGIIQQIMLAFLPFSAGVAFAISGALSSVFSIVWYPLYATGVVLLYYDLRARQESFDLQLRVSELEVEIEDATP